MIFIGDFKSPVAVGTYKELYRNLDEEFYTILGIYSWFKSGLIDFKFNKMPYEITLAVKYLIDYNEKLNKEKQIG